MFFSKHVTASELARSIFVPVVLALAAGIAGALIVEAYFAALSAATPEPLQIGRLPTASNGPLSQAELAERLERASLPLYARRASGAELSERARGFSEAVGFAAVLTSDGWLATAPSAVASPVGVAVGGRLLAPTLQILDPRTGVVFLKVEVSALPVSPFEETETLQAGSTLYALDEGGLFRPSAFAGTTPVNRRAQAPQLQNADAFTRTFRLERFFGPRAAGGAVLSGDGDLSGVLVSEKKDQDLFVPMHLIRPVLAQIFRGEIPVRAQLGVHYLPLDRVAFAEGGFGGLKGARLTGTRSLGLPAVRPGSAAAKAGLQEGDILLRVDGEDLSGDRDLGELIGALEPGHPIRFDVLKDGAERAVEVTLDAEKR